MLHRRVAAIAIIVLIPVVILTAAFFALRWAVRSWEPKYPSAGPEIAALQADRGVNLVAPGTSLLDSGSRTACLGPDFDGGAPAVWRDFNRSGSEKSFLDFYRSSLPAAGWTLTSDSGDPTTRTLSFSRSFGSWEADIIVSDRELLAEVEQPDFFCTPKGGTGND